MVQKIDYYFFRSKYIILMKYNSVFTVIPTFFTSEGIFMEAILQHIDNQHDKQIKNIVILGTTSESCTLSIEERKTIAITVWKKFNKDLNIVIGLSGNNTKDVKEEATFLKDYCHAFMLSAPYYNKPSQYGIYEHYKEIVSSCEKEFIIYNVPSRCGVNIEPTTVAKLANTFKNIVAIKEASGSIEQVMKIKSLCNISILSGDDALTLPFMSIGASGVISVISNIIPEVMLNIIDTFNKGNISESNIIFYKYYELMKLAFCDSNPVPIKYMLSLKEYNKCLSSVRLPLVQLSDDNKNKITSELNHLLLI